MNKAVLISIQPKWCELIANGQKTIEVRKTKPKIDTPFKCYIYCTNDRKIMLERSNYDKSIYLNGNIYYPYKADCSLNGKVIGEFVCDYIYNCDADSAGLFEKGTGKRLPECCLNWEELFSYSKGKLPIYGWHISDLVIYDHPKEINEFKRMNRTEDNVPCAHTKWLYAPCETCKECNLTRPPQSWCYVDT